MDELSARAAEWGIERAFTDALGQYREAPAETLSRLLQALSEGTAPQAASYGTTPGATPGTAPCFASNIVWRGRDRPPLPPPPDGGAWALIDERGNTLAESRGGDTDRAALAELPLGIYALQARGDARARRHLIVAPPQARQPESAQPERVWVLAVQLYAVRSRRNWGHGDFSDLRQLLRIAAAAGAAGIGLNPLHALFDDRAEQASPYSPNSRLFLNPLYIDVDAVPEFPGLASAGLAAPVERLRRADMIAYAEVAAVKAQALRCAYARFRDRPHPSRAQDLDRFRGEQGPPLRRFATFEVLRRRFAGAWWAWPEPYRQPSPTLLDEVARHAAEEIGFYEYVQWIADRQLAACGAEALRLGLPVGLYTDVAVGADPGGADAWSEQGAIVPQVEIGAPPDALNTAGQAWGLAAFNPRVLAGLAYAPFRRVLRAAMRHAGAVRLDHVLGLNRLYLIPLGLGPAAGAYVHYPLQELLAVVALESERNRCTVVGEDLGTVPENLRSVLADWGLWSYLVLLFERRHDGAFRPPHDYRRNALVTFGTHDLPSFSGWITGHDLDVKRGLGLDPGESDAAREHARGALRDALARSGAGTPDAPMRLLDVLRFLARTPSRILSVALDDVFGVRDQPNVPGTIMEHPNWRRRLPAAIETLADNADFRRVAAMLREEGRAAPPAGR